MIWTRNLKKGDRGADVLEVKLALFSLGYYEKHITAIKKDAFGDDTVNAVRAFQKTNVGSDGKKLAVDGIVGRQTIESLNAALGKGRPAGIPLNIGAAAARSIHTSLDSVASGRKSVVLNALTFAFDAAAGAREYPISLYIRGGNLYGKDLKLERVTAASIEAGAARQPKYYAGGRRELMLAAARKNPNVSGADCSGGIVGLLRKNRLVAPSFDATADVLASKRYGEAIAIQALAPGDFVGRPQHIGVYAGGGYVAEWIGGSYGCQLTKLEGRRAWDFLRKRSVKLGAWTRFVRPDFYR